MRSRRSSDAANALANYPVSSACSDFRASRRSLTSGDGVARDLTKAEQLNERGCEGRYPHACTSHARLLFARREVDHDTEWLALFEYACQQHDGFACGRLGAIYQNGDGVPEDPQLGAQFAQRACVLGELELCSTTATQTSPVAPRAESK